MSKKDHLSWTSQMDELFIEEMLHQSREGNRPEGTFTSAAYANMVNELHERFPQYEFTKNHLKNRLKTLKDRFNKCHDLFKNLSGFSWRPDSKMWEAEPEVWRTLIKAKPEAKKWMTKPVNDYDKLEELFAKDRATGEGAMTAKERKRSWSNSNNEGVAVTEIDVDDDDSSLERIVDLGDGLDSNNTQASTPQSDDGTQSNKKKKKASRTEQENDQMKNALDNIAQAIREGNTAITEGNAAIKEGNAAIREGNAIHRESHSRIYSETEIYKELEAINLQSEFIDEAYFFLAQNPDKARILFGCPPHKRLATLERLTGVSLRF